MALSDYKKYFRKLAIINKLIHHDPNSEDLQNPAGESHFTYFDNDEIVSDALRGSVGPGPALHLHNYEWVLTDNTAFDRRNRYTAAFIVSTDMLPNDVQTQDSGYAITETIVNQLLAKIMYDHGPDFDRCKWPLGEIDWNNLQVTPVGPIWNWRVGWYVEFPYKKIIDGLPGAETINQAFDPDPDLQVFDTPFETTFE